MIGVLLFSATLATQTGVEQDKDALFVRPFMYGTVIVIAAIIISSVACVYSMNDEKDPLIYSKFLTIKKKNM